MAKILVDEAGASKHIGEHGAKIVKAIED